MNAYTILYFTDLHFVVFPIFFNFTDLSIMHLSMWILLGCPPGCPMEFRQRKCFSVRITTLPWTFTVRIPSQKIYFSTICNVRISEQCQKELLLSESPLLYGQMDSCQNPGLGGISPQGSRWQTSHYFKWYKIFGCLLNITDIASPTNIAKLYSKQTFLKQ